MTTKKVRVRFCPSPTGTPHVGLVRTALFNWAYARHTGGDFVFRIEDTDAARDSDESYAAILDALRWLGMDWDEGPEVGGPYEPYRQSQRREIYRDVVARLLEAGEVYEAYSTPEEVEARHLAAGRNPKLGYDNYDRDLTDAQRKAFADEGRRPVLRLRMPDEDLSWNDLVRGPTTFAAGSVPDFAITRSNGDPLYTLVNPVDDALMKITHVLRGEDILPSTPRQIALYRALMRIGVAEFVPEFAHLPSVLGEGNKKLSKRDPQSNLFLHRDRGFIPEGLLNYLALLGWGIADDHDVFSLDEMVAAFDVADVNSNPARFDQKKADAINAEHIRMLAPEDFTARLREYFVTHGYDTTLDDAAFAEAAALVQTRVVVLGDAWGLLKFFNDDAYEIDEKSAAKELKPESAAVLDAALSALEAVGDWTTPAIEAALKTALLEGLELKPRKAFGPIRVAVTGAAVSPPLFESMELLGRDRSLARLRAARDRV
ncbi:glutamate--tRNA ligase [Mycolicibacterium smegmatis]|uniref:Glutamate--tRNA ligase n=2 Tax=Mycolicibacterium smegmatis TaxID=1772 RepID=SYE_MYCS2|nr:glutamate--tRNA ligase [Mycolicibacterium smegmatis]A0QUY7.1 RecName: Full=Glutamate--tRNA ligase; AltName: Full=Glutamyl-tRNA synthetase; Short=GluRS [Mycolicibacterium smegmatis MC2 155]ABK74186.1 glutamyl-tRNA synthetase [Mycolicibacterium smegmatis MC2 155]AFP38793.1 Glutamyl-tRNA synthetase [Mycolicibacterium smegmatis MC2 155]AIU07568.1 glutamyl-tRNA synthetase [Mycolicibacterium smegmatis MC2 155]AIU14193.1 glutamyl-tRNA synthetase [Mycolicibacterium smegmatis]AIU20816.1 glutamyl-tR